MPDPEPLHLFVYGTLRRSSRHLMARHLAQHARHLGPGRTRGRLYDLGAFPGLKDADGEDDWVRGEVYELRDPARTLPHLDAYEGCGPNDRPPYLFERHRRPVQLNDGRFLTAWVYLFNRPVSPDQHIPSGDFFER